MGDGPLLYLPLGAVVPSLTSYCASLRTSSTLGTSCRLPRKSSSERQREKASSSTLQNLIWAGRLPRLCPLAWIVTLQVAVCGYPKGGKGSQDTSLALPLSSEALDKSYPCLGFGFLIYQIGQGWTIQKTSEAQEQCLAPWVPLQGLREGGGIVCTSRQGTTYLWATCLLTLDMAPRLSTPLLNVKHSGPPPEGSPIPSNLEFPAQPHHKRGPLCHPGGWLWMQRPPACQTVQENYPRDVWVPSQFVHSACALSW